LYITFRKEKFISDDIWFNFASLSWITGVFTLISGTLHGAKRVITTRGFDTKLMIEILQRHKVTITLAAPVMLEPFKSNLKQPLDSMRVLFVGGAVVSKEMCEAIKAFIPNGEICSIYACSEGGGISVSYSNCKYGSAGQVNANVQIKVNILAYHKLLCKF